MTLGPEMSSWLPSTRAATIVCVGAHSDDIEIGCGATLLRLVEEVEKLSVLWVVLASDGEERKREAERSAALLLPGVDLDLRIHSFRGRYLPYEPAVKEAFDRLGTEVQPDLVFCPRQDDAHQDHRTASELVWNTFRRSPIWEYEIVKYEGDLGQPNLFVPMTSGQLDRKVSHLMGAFKSQLDRYWYTEETFRALARLRGIECRSPSGYAEAFHARKVVVS